MATKQPDESMKITTVFWHFARGMALAGKGKGSEAEAELKIVSEAEKATPEDVPFAMPVNNKAKDVLRIAETVLAAKIAMANGDRDGAISHLQEAVTIQDTLKYNEPQDWFYPVRESLGAAQMMKGDASGAEKTFRDDLDRNPRNPRSLYGLQEALKKQGRDYDAGFVEKQFKASWKGGTTTLKMEDLV
jgi:tetratricopeptide (TPR) repeat protein